MYYKEIVHLLDSNYQLLNVIRCHKNIDRVNLLNYVEQSWPTISKNIDELKKANILINKESYEINPYLGYYVGISIGGSQIKLCILDMCYSVLSYNDFMNLISEYNLFQNMPFLKFAADDQKYGYIYTYTPETTASLQEMLFKLISEIIKFDQLIDINKQHVYGIGLAFTGAIDNKNKKIIKAYSLKFLDSLPLSYDSLIYNSCLAYFNIHNINFSMDNIAKCAIISEKFNLYNNNNFNYIYSNRKNIACIYLGSGIGGSLILNNNLYRGTSNFNELGHIDVIDPDFLDVSKCQYENNDLHCSCGGTNCLEYKIRKNVFNLNFDNFKSLTSVELESYFDTFPDKEYRLRLLAFYIGQAIKTLTNILNLDLIILTGKLTVFMNELSKYLYEEKSKNHIGYTNSDCTMITSSYGALAPSIGAAILSSIPKDNNLIYWK